MLVAVMTMTIFSFVIAYPRMREEEGGKSVASMVILLILSALVLVSAIGHESYVCALTMSSYVSVVALDAHASQNLSALAASCVST